MNILTAEEFLIKQGCQRMRCDNLECKGVGDFFEDVQPKDLTEFAKMHVKAALEKGAKSYIMYESDREKIRNSYPLENIK